MLAVDPVRWRELSALLDQTLELDPDGRAALVASVRNARPDLAATLEGQLARVEELADDWATEGPSLVKHAHNARDVHEGSTLEQCANDLRAALNPEPTP